MLVALSVLGSVALFAIISYLLEWWVSSPAYHGPVSDHFDGEHFYSIGLSHDIFAPKGENRSGRWPSFARMWKWVFFRPKNPWQWRENNAKAVPQERVEGDKLVITMINHATVLIQTHGLNIITDPVWSSRASPVQFAGPRRFAPPGIDLADLPPIDLVLLTHNHYDHMDLAALRAITRRDRAAIYTSLGNSAYLASKGIPGGIDMDWWDRKEVSSDVHIVSVPAQHFAARALRDRNRSLWCGFVIETPEGNIYFAGDTGYGAFAAEIKKRYSSFRVGLIPIGAYKPEWMMRTVHISPDEALSIHRELGIETSIGIHWGTFKMADDGQDEPKEHLARLVMESNDHPDFRTLGNGELLVL